MPPHYQSMTISPAGKDAPDTPDDGFVADVRWRALHDTLGRIKAE